MAPDRVRAGRGNPESSAMPNEGLFDRVTVESRLHGHRSRRGRSGNRVRDDGRAGKQHDAELLRSDRSAYEVRKVLEVSRAIRRCGSYVATLPEPGGPGGIQAFGASESVR